jgi:uncharacterized protein (TIGR02117 family)
LLLSALPLGTPSPVAGGTKIHVVSNGWHVSLVLPVGDWPRDLAHGPYRVDVSQARLVAFGWGERRFYMDTRTFADIDFATGLRALAWNADTVVHATFLDAVDEAHPRVRTLIVSQAQLDALNAHVRESFAAATPEPVGDGFGPADAFFRARGVYSPIATCNEWVGAALRNAGIPIGAWTPLSQSLLWRLP